MRIEMSAPLFLFLVILFCAFNNSAWGQIQVNIDAGSVRHTVSPTLFGIFFEEINHAGDGGLYAELVQNRGFDANTTHPGSGSLDGWETIQGRGSQIIITLDNTSPLNANSGFSAKLTTTSSGTDVGIANSGYWGIAIQPPYICGLSFFVKNDADFIVNKGQLLITLESADGLKIYYKTIVGPFPQLWTKQEFTLSFLPEEVVDTKARLAFRLTAPGSLWLDVVSLFPATFRGRPNGVRTDLAYALADLNPKFLRFPGGNFVEGYEPSSAFLWKNTIGPIENRPGHMGVWGYWSTDGLGLLEYLQFCEDLRVQPIWVVSVGIFLGDGAIPLDEIEPWIQDALDSIEYITGPVTSKWGAVRAQNGHPEPFVLKYLALGNENGCNFDKNHIYVQYYNIFAPRIRAVYPNLQFIANCDITTSSPSTRAYVDLFDYHVYSTPQWFLDNTVLFDSQNRSGPSVFVSEYAVTNGGGNGNLQAAVAEAAFMTGLVRNSDIVKLASYAPLFVNVNDRKWNPDIVQFDNHATAPTPSYYVQQLFAYYTGDKLLAHSVTNGNTNFATVATFDSANSRVYIPIVNFSPNSTLVDISLSNINVATLGFVDTLTSDSGNPLDENTLSDPFRVSARTSPLLTAPQFQFNAPAYSVSVLQIYSK